jgi:glycosyltransferase involved in cell wall biosynthesis
MRIGISTSVIQRGQTGIGQYLFALLRAMAACDTRHRFVLFVLEDDLPLFQFVHDSMELVPVPERFRPPVKNILWHQAHLPRLVRRHQLDVLHVPSYRRLLGTKPCALVGTIHDLAPFRIAGKYDWKRMFYGRVIARRLARLQDAIIAISENTARDITRFFGLPRERLTVIHNGLEHSRFFPADRAEAKAQITARHGLRKPFFLYVARLEHPAKNHVRLIAAFNQFKTVTQSDWQLVFGGSDWHGAEAIHATIARSPVSQDILTLGFVPDLVLPDLYRAADAFVYPSLYEGFGMPPVEAMACGCPVVCSTRGSLGEIVGDAAAMVDPEDVHSIVKQLHRVASDNELRSRLRAAGLAQARQFDWDRAGAATVQVYERVAGARESSFPEVAALRG